MEKSKMTEEEEDNLELEYFKSERFRKEFKEQVEEDTWGKGLPKIYMDKDKNIVEHWKDGTINIIKYAAEKD